MNDKGEALCGAITVVDSPLSIPEQIEDRRVLILVPVMVVAHPIVGGAGMEERSVDEGWAGQQREPVVANCETVRQGV
jgi:hypothetical protein